MRPIHLLACLFVSLMLNAQVPQALEFQGIARDNSGNPLPSQSIALRLSVINSTPVGPVVYQESHAVNTSALGLFTVQIGNGSALLGAFNTIAWAAGPYYLKVEFDPAGGSNFQDMGTTQFLSVPYAFVAGSSLNCFSVSMLGDTLFQGNGCFVIIPGISAANGGCADSDQDGFYDQAGCGTPIDCDDEDTSVAPNFTFYQDMDGDGYGTNAQIVEGCEPPPGFATLNGDCDDTDPQIFPGQNCSQFCNASDQAWLDQNMEEYFGYLSEAFINCGFPTTQEGFDCMADQLINMGVPVSADCHQCGIAAFNCIMQNCMGQCLSGQSQCFLCAANSGCLSGFITCASLTDADGDGWSAGSDCDDTDPTVHPFASEICDGQDNDCDGIIDEGVNTQTDPNNCGGCGVVCPEGFGCINGNCAPCTDNDQDGYTTCDGDCDDSNLEVNPGAVDICDGVDNNCDGVIDEGLAYDIMNCGACGVVCPAPPNSSAYCTDGICGFFCDPDYADCDGDPMNGCETYLLSNANCGGCNLMCPQGTTCSNGICVSNCSIDADCPSGMICQNGICVPDCPDADADGYTTCDGDCDDTNASFNPGAMDDCNGNDNNCDGIIANSVDQDADGFTSCAGDCDDMNAQVWPGATEICDGLDNDCDGLVDEDGICPPSCTDGIQNGQETAVDCGGPDCPPCQQCTDNDQDGFTTCNGDCNDANAAINPSAFEQCDGIDNDCDGQIDEGFGTITCGTGACQVTISACANGQMQNCVPNTPSIEVCDAIDNDCDGMVDEGGVCSSTCTDGILNGQETGVDCGGPSCQPCPAGQGCLSNNDCGPGLICQGGICVTAPCPPGMFDCDGQSFNGCEVDTQTDPQNCGGCGMVCPQPPNTVVQCVNGTCFFSCSPDYGDCDNDMNNGCETYLLTSSNCGACGVVCPSGTTCQNGICVQDCPVANTPCDDGNACTMNDLADGACGCVGTPVICNDGNSCTFDQCVNGTCVFTIVPNGTSCPSGLCQNGTCVQNCPDNDMDGFTTCNGDCDDTNASIRPSAQEVCNGVDDDCDGQIDEGLGTLTCGTGACQNTVPACLNGVPQTCTINPSSPEVCDGVDNDCDGSVDEGDPGGGATCNTGLAGVCAQGITVCSNGLLICQPINSPSAEVCDGLDNDCDGQVDEGCVPQN